MDGCSLVTTFLSDVFVCLFGEEGFEKQQSEGSFLGVVLFGNSGKGGFIIISDGGWVNKKMNQPCFSQMKTVFTVLSAHFPPQDLFTF